MIAVDTSSFVSYFSGNSGSDVELVEVAFEKQQVVFPPVVLSELLSDSKLIKKVIDLIKEIPILSIEAGYWERVGILRSKVLSKGYKARLADSLIAQCCIDHEVPLVTRDLDFRHFVRLGGLKLL